MIHVIAEIQLNPESKEKFLTVLHQNRPIVTAEKMGVWPMSRPWTWMPVCRCRGN